MNMKAWVAILAVVGLAGSAWAQWPGQGVTVWTTNIVLLPRAKPTTTNQWRAATAYVRGDEIVSSNGAPYYWCVTAGTSTNTIPTFGTTNDVTDGPSCVWRMVIADRRAFTLVNNGSAVLYLGLGHAAVTNRGIALYAGDSFSDGYGGGLDVWAGQVNGVMSTGSGNVSIQER